MLSIDINKISIDERELLSRLGSYSDRVSVWENRLRDSVCPLYTYKSVPVIDNGIDFGVFVSGNTLTRALDGCKNAYLFAVTLGSGADRVIKSASLLSALDGFVADAVASAMCEAVCDSVQSLLPQKTKNRVSIGYGDIDIRLQKPFLEFLRAENITLTDSYLMVPTKSITAIAGVKE